MTQYDDGTTSATYAYDDLGRKISETVNYGPFTKTISADYYANSLKKSFTLPDNEAITYTYDENNRLTGIGFPGQGQVTRAYDSTAWNAPVSIQKPGGSKTDYAYDPLMRVISILAKDPGGNTILSHHQTYAVSGVLTSLETENGTSSFEYDNLYRLTGATHPTLPTEGYSYDALGNRLTSAATATPWQYNADNQLLGYDSTAFTYDPNGNILTRTVNGKLTTYTHDPEDRMIKVENDDTTAEYYYDPFGRRLSKTVDGQTTYFLYSEEGLVAEYDETGTEIKQYGWTPGNFWGTDPLYLKENGSYYWYENDARGAPHKLTSSSGRIVWQGVYDAFGNCTIELAEIENNLRLPGQYFDAETGLHYNLNRYYDPVLGRYLRPDPFGDGMNLYAYCFNNPMGPIDPLGLCAIKKAWKGFTDTIKKAITTFVIAIGKMYYYTTAWHFEIRTALNKDLPATVHDAEKHGWIRMPEGTNKYHDNGRGNPEIKFVHPDGREALYDGDYKTLIILLRHLMRNLLAQTH